MFLAENEFAYARMKPICSNDEIELPHASVFEGNQNAGRSCLVNALDTRSFRCSHGALSQGTRLQHVQSRGLCAFHTWKYEGLASPQGGCTGYFPLLLSLSEDLNATAVADMPTEEMRKNLLAYIPRKSHCSACEIRAPSAGEPSLFRSGRLSLLGRVLHGRVWMGAS
jgi:hypothetical protein